MMTKTERLNTSAWGSFDGNSRPLAKAAVDVAKRFCMTRVPRRAWLVGLGLAVGIILTTGGSAAAAPNKPSCTTVVSGGKVFEILDNQTYALCATASCLVFNEVAYCTCDVLSGESISLSLDFDSQDVCSVNEDGVKNGYMVSTFSVPPSNPNEAIYICPGGSNGSYAQCDGGICFKSTQKQSFPGPDGLVPLAKDEIICSCPIATEQNAMGYQISGPFPCDNNFFKNCSSAVANDSNGSTLYVGAPTGTGDLLAALLTGKPPPSSHNCTPP